LKDIDIIRNSKMLPIKDLAAKSGLKMSELSLYGNYMAKISLDALKRRQAKKDGKLILVSAINPTPAGEGKSTTTIGLVDAMNKLGKKCVGAIREPSMGFVFGVKGGAAGGGYAQVNPMEKLNLHFTGDFHAITTANNLVSAAIDNHIYHGNSLNIDENNIVWKRCLDLNDRALRKVEVGLSSKKEANRYDYFNITAASEIMAILCLANSIQDLKNRLDNSLIAYSKDVKPLYIKDLEITGSLMVILNDAIKPNIVQTLENNLMLVHGGPFANIAHGCNSLFATKLGLKVSDYLITEAGFGADLGAEKFLNIKCQEGNLKPNLVILVATIRALKYHGGVKLGKLEDENISALKKGVENLEKHIETIKLFNINCVVTINKFASDTIDEINFLRKWAKENNVKISLSEVYEKGGTGGLELAQQVIENVGKNPYEPLYNLEDTLVEKIGKIAYNIYGATSINYDNDTYEKLQYLDKNGYRNFYICMAKTPNSLTDDAKVLGRPKDFAINIREIRISTGSKFIICLTGKVMTMPGLSKKPQATVINLDEDGNITGLM